MNLGCLFPFQISMKQCKTKGRIIELPGRLNEHCSNITLVADNALFYVDSELEGTASLDSVNGTAMFVVTSMIHEIARGTIGDDVLSRDRCLACPCDSDPTCMLRCCSVDLVEISRRRQTRPRLDQTLTSDSSCGVDCVKRVMYSSRRCCDRNSTIVRSRGYSILGSVFR